MNELFIKFLQMVDNAMLRERMQDNAQAIIFWKNALWCIDELNEGESLFIGKEMAEQINMRVELLSIFL